MLTILNLGEMDTLLLHLTFLLKKRARKQKAHSEVNTAKCPNLPNWVDRSVGVCHVLFMLEMLQN